MITKVSSWGIWRLVNLWVFVGLIRFKICGNCIAKRPLEHSAESKHVLRWWVFSWTHSSLTSFTKPSGTCKWHIYKESTEITLIIPEHFLLKNPQHQPVSESASRVGWELLTTRGSARLCGQRRWRHKVAAARIWTKSAGYHEDALGNFSEPWQKLNNNNWVHWS